MWSCLIAVVAVVTLAAGDDQAAGLAGGLPAGARAFAEPRLAASGMRLARLERDLGELKNKVEEARKLDPEGFLNDLNGRINHVEAETDHCDSNKEVRCGPDTYECVNTLLLCDGHSDCHNGWDEEAHTCSPGPAVSGNVFVGTAHWVSCQNRDDHPVKITITGTYKAKFFGARIGVRGVVSADFVDHDGHDDEHHHEFEVKGLYQYGKKRLALFPTTEQVAKEHFGIVCKFVHGNDETAECMFASEATLFKCATMHVSLQQ